MMAQPEPPPVAPPPVAPVPGGPVPGGPIPGAPPAAAPGPVTPSTRSGRPAPPAIEAAPAPLPPKAPSATRPVPAPPPVAVTPAYGESADRDGKRRDLSNPFSAPHSGGPAAALTRNMLDEELSSNPQAAAKTYEAMIANFDQQRETAAQSIFRLGELYRKTGRIDEARSLYARILREFVDFPDLVKLSQRLLTENAPAQRTRRRKI
jgi:TolA-binding protein